MIFISRVAKELSHRADELKELGWSQDDVLRYAELWDYRQRWGSINLEREDRQFLRKAEAALPKIVSGKISTKKPTSEKSYYCWLSFYLSQMKQQEDSFASEKGSLGVWRILLEEELRLLDYYEPVLGLPDTIKAKALLTKREEIVAQAIDKFKEQCLLKRFDFIKPLDDLKNSEGKASWKYLREAEKATNKDYPLLTKDSALQFRQEVRALLPEVISSLLPSLQDTDKPLPPENWSRE